MWVTLDWARRKAVYPKRFNFPPTLPFLALPSTHAQSEAAGSTFGAEVGENLLLNMLIAECWDMSFRIASSTSVQTTVKARGICCLSFTESIWVRVGMWNISGKYQKYSEFLSPCKGWILMTPETSLPWEGLWSPHICSLLKASAGLLSTPPAQKASLHHATDCDATEMRDWSILTFAARWRESVSCPHGHLPPVRVACPNTLYYGSGQSLFNYSTSLFNLDQGPFLGFRVNLHKLGWGQTWAFVGPWVS